MRKILSCALLLLMPLVGTPRAVSADPLPRTTPARAGFAADRLDRLHRFTRGLVDEHKYSGITTLILRNGRIVDWQTYGERSAGVPLRPDDLFAIASLTRIVATVGTLSLIEEGRLGLNDSIADYLPEFKDLKVAVNGTNPPTVLVDAARPITVKQLLTHTSGLSSATPLKASDAVVPSQSNGDFTSLADVTRNLSAHALLHQPGDAWVYGPSTDVLGRLVEVVSGKPFNDFLAERVLGPLKMRATSFEVADSQRTRQVTFDVRQPDGSIRSVAPKPRQHPWPSGAGGLYSTTADYARFAQMLLNGGELEGVRILGPKTIELMTMDHLHGLAKPTKIYPVSDGFGLGVEVRTDVARSGWLGSYGTFGWNGATTAYCSIDPKERLIAMIWAQHTPNAEFQLYERFNTLVYQALVR